MSRCKCVHPNPISCMARRHDVGEDLILCLDAPCTCECHETKEDAEDSDAACKRTKHLSHCSVWEINRLLRIGFFFLDTGEAIQVRVGGTCTFAHTQNGRRVVHRHKSFAHLLASKGLTLHDIRKDWKYYGRRKYTIRSKGW